MATIRNNSMIIYLSVVGITLAAIAGTVIALGMERSAKGTSPKQEEPARAEPLHPVQIKKRGGPPRIATGQTDFHGAAVTVSCSTCHATTAPNRELKSAADLDEFHQGMKFSHGQLSCLSCHNPGDYDTLRLADGSPVAFQDVQQLCAQCHGPQTRDYRNGSHGGMTGFWDLTKGPRTRNNCTDCHDAHSPQYPMMTPVFPPPPAARKTGSNH